MKRVGLLYVFFFFQGVYCARKYPTRRWLQVCNISNHITKYINNTTTTLCVFLKENREDLYL